MPTTNSAVIPSVVPDPVYQQTADAQGYGWFYTVNLTEVAGAATTLTDFTINGTSYASSIASFFGSASMAAHGSLSASLRTKGLTVPTTVVFGFSGRDSNGHLWTQQLQVPFYALQITASVLLTSVPAVVRENMLAGRCPFSPDWYENLGLQEQNGHSVTLNTFKAGQFTFDSTTSTSIQDFFGSTTLPAYGSLLAGICWPDLTPPVTEAYEIDGTDDLGNPISARTSVLFDVPPPSGATLSVGSPSISLTVASASQTASTTLSVDVAPGSPWTISVFPLNRTTRWLGVYPLSGIGPGSVTVSGFDPALTGTDNATLAVQAVNAFPQFINVPVTLSVGGGSSGGTTGWIIPQVVDGGGLPAGWQTTFGVTNTNLTTANATLQFFKADASGNTQAWNLPLIENVSTNNMQLAPGETIFLHTPDTAPTLTQGFGELIADPGVVAYAIFTLHVPGRQNQDGTALAAAPGLQTMIPFDNAVGFTTTIAVVNASGSPETLSAVLTLKNGQTVTSSLPAIPARGHAAFALAAQFPQSVGQEGTLTLTSSSPDRARRPRHSGRVARGQGSERGSTQPAFPRSPDAPDAGGPLDGQNELIATATRTRQRPQRAHASLPALPPMPRPRGLRDGRQRRLAVGPREQVGDHAFGHRLAGPDRRRADMGQEHRIGKRDQLGGNAGLVLVDVEAGGQNLAGPERLDQRLLVDERAARHVDQHPVRPQRVENLGVDDMARRGAAGRDDDQNVRGFGHLDQRSIVAIGDARLRMAAVVDDVKPEAADAGCDRLADPPEPDDFRPSGLSAKE